MTASPARRVALETVTRVRERNAFAHETFDAVLGATSLSPRDIAFAARLAYGTIACRGTLDAAVREHLRDPSTLEPAVGDALALSAYEILFMRTPARAAVNEGVELVAAHRKAAAGLANAVLRRLAERAPEFPWGDPAHDLSALARQYGHPEWLVKLLIDEHGREDAEGILAADNEPAPLFLAWLPSMGTFESLLSILEEDGAGPHPCPLPGCIVVDDPSAARRSRALTQRLALVMDAGAQFAAAMSSPAGGSRVVEIGAGRGSKSILLASHATAESALDLRAIDLHEYKLASLAKTAAATGARGIETLVADATAETIGVPDGWADVVLVDAPCSGLGTLRRHPDRRWRANADEIGLLADLGARMLERASRLVGPEGFMVYSTCTITRRENADVIETFLASDAGSDFIVDPLDQQVPDEWRGLVKSEGWFQSLPAHGGPDGHFVARLRRR